MGPSYNIKSNHARMIFNWKATQRAGNTILTHTAATCLLATYVHTFHRPLQPPWRAIRYNGNAYLHLSLSLAALECICLPQNVVWFSWLATVSSLATLQLQLQLHRQMQLHSLCGCCQLGKCVLVIVADLVLQLVLQAFLILVATKACCLLFGTLFYGLLVIGNRQSTIGNWIICQYVNNCHTHNWSEISIRWLPVWLQTHKMNLCSQFVYQIKTHTHTTRHIFDLLIVQQFEINTHQNIFSCYLFATFVPLAKN